MRERTWPRRLSPTCRTCTASASWSASISTCRWTKSGDITNDRRIRAALPTLKTLLDAGAALIVMSHLGRPKGDPKNDAPFKMDHVAARLRELLGKPVKKVDEVVGPAATAAAQALKPGEVLVLENLRFHPGEQAKDDAAFAAATGETRRRLRQRRLRHLPPQGRVDGAPCRPP